MKALVISMVAGVVLCSLMSVPALARPNLGVATSDRALGKNVHDYRRYYGYRYSYGYRPSYYSYGYRPSYFSYGYRPNYYGYGPSSPRYP